MLTGAKNKALQMKATIDWSSFEDEIEDYLATASPQMWRKVFTPLIRGIMIDQGERWANVLGVTFDVQNLGARDWFNRYMLKFAQEIGQTTKEYVSNVLDLAMTEGWSIPMMQDRITEVFGHMAVNDPANLEWYLDRMPAYRSEMIARTETIRASNAGTTELFSEWGVKRHEWLSTQDDRTRGPDSEESPSEYDHIGSNGEIVDIGEPFTLTGEPLMYPGDPAGSPGNTINCRCTTIPVIEGME